LRGRRHNWYQSARDAATLAWLLAAAAGLVVSAVVGAGAAAGHAPSARAAYAQQCPDYQYPASRDPSNPLVLPTPPGSDPLHGAHLFIDGPRHGVAAGAITTMLGIDPTSYPDDYSWARFEHDIAGRLGRMLHGGPSARGRAHDALLLEKIADEQETQNISLYAGGGGPGAIFGQVQKLLCHNLTADPTPHTVPVFSTFFVYPSGQFCPSLGAILGNWRTFKRQIDELAAGTGRHPVVYLLEIDAVGTIACLTRAARAAWESDLRYEIEKLTALPHTVVYVEGGASDEATPSFIAHVLDAICVVRRHGKRTNVCALMRGFFTNGTHFDWSSGEIRWADKVSHALERLILAQTHETYVADFVVNSAQNGRGPKRNPGGVGGIEDLCNPPGRGLGRKPTANTSPTFDGHTFPLLDGFLWTGTPGRSHNSDCHPGDAPAGVFDPRFALELASNANQKLGPGYPGQPY
jgi:endoglucanase